MTQAETEYWEKHGDGAALKYLERRGFKPNRGGIIYFFGDWGREPHLFSGEVSAINYLCSEWDYGWEGFDFKGN